MTVRVLVTNDDGVAAPGLVALAAGLVAAGHDVVVAAPSHDHSGSGAGIGPVGVGAGIEVARVELPGIEATPAFSVDGPPALAVMAARLGAFGPEPHVVVSGVNPGTNTGRSVLHSGTVGAALTAANFGISGLATSIAAGEPSELATAVLLATAALAWLTEAPARTVLNLNVPNLTPADVRGVRNARLAPFGTVRAAMAESRDGLLQIELSETKAELDPDTDTALVMAGYAAITALVGVRATEEVDASAALAEVLQLELEAAR
jgi:5'-nucleotidase